MPPGPPAQARARRGRGPAGGWPRRDGRGATRKAAGGSRARAASTALECRRDRHRRPKQASGTGSSQITSMIIIPDWGALIGLLPVFILLGVIGPIITLLLLGPHLPDPPATREGRPRRRPAPGRARRRREADLPDRPAVLPCRRLIYPSGTTRCETTAPSCAVVCPMCGLGRQRGRSTPVATAASSSRSRTARGRGPAGGAGPEARPAPPSPSGLDRCR